MVDDLSAKSKESLKSDFEPTLDVLSPFIDKIISEFPQEHERYGLDEVIVASIAPIVRLIFLLLSILLLTISLNSSDKQLCPGNL